MLVKYFERYSEVKTYRIINEYYFLVTSFEKNHYVLICSVDIYNQVLNFRYNIE